MTAEAKNRKERRLVEQQERHRLKSIAVVEKSVERSVERSVEPINQLAAAREET